MQQRSRRRQEALRRVLGVDAGLEGVSDQRDLVLGERQRLAGGDAELPFDEVEAGDRLGDRVLDLERVFISMNQKPSGRSGPEPSTMNSMVPALRSRPPAPP